MVRSDKIDLVAKVIDNLRQSQSVILTDFKGMTVAEMTDLRSRLREQSIRMKVVKNRLIRRALGEAGCDSVDDLLHGNSALVFGIEDPVAPAKILTEFAAKHERLVIKGGLLEGRRLDKAGVLNLSRMPGRKELLAMMAGGMKQPAAKLAMAFQAGLLKMAYAMQALAQKKEESGEAAA